MGDPASYKFPSPTADYKDAAPLLTQVAEDGKSLKNPDTGKLSSAYEKFPAPLDNGRRGGL